jgi:hypothetical protein
MFGQRGYVTYTIDSEELTFFPDFVHHLFNIIKCYFSAGSSALSSGANLSSDHFRKSHFITVEKIMRTTYTNNKGDFFVIFYLLI